MNHFCKISRLLVGLLQVHRYLLLENIEGSIVIDPSFIKKPEDCFALKLKGDSMINAGIFEGDLVIVSRNNEAINGDIVVAMLDDEVTVKTFEKKE